MTFNNNFVTVTFTPIPDGPKLRKTLEERQAIRDFIRGVIEEHRDEIRNVVNDNGTLTFEVRPSRAASILEVCVLEDFHGMFELSFIP